MEKQQIKWKVIEVEIAKIKPTPNNFKLKTEDGTARFKTSVDNYGLAGAQRILFLKSGAWTYQRSHSPN